MASLDALRGLVMVIMALDHVREFFHTGAMSFQPEDLSRTTVALFLTRWVTHICAPVFAFTAGAGAWLWFSRRRDTGQLSSFLWKRGVWLVVLDLIVVRFAMFFSLTSGMVILNVLWMLGWSMVLLSVLVRLPVRIIAALSGAVVVLHHLADPVQASAFGSASWVWNILHQPGVFLVKGAVVLVAYPLVPWFAVMALGFCFGSLLQSEARRKWMLRLGLGLTLAFLVVRVLNVYGDPQPWAVQSSPAMTVLSFLRTSKYPPSLSFLLMTLGPALLIWRWMETFRFDRANPLIVFGRVPLFYFVVHLYVIHALVYAFAFVRYGNVVFLANPLPSLGGPPETYPRDFGYNLLTVYGVWALVLILLYPLCRHFAGLKERRKEWWLSYL